MIIRSIELQHNVFFVDEAVFSASTASAFKVWSKKGGGPFKARNKLRCEAVAVVGAIDIKGNVVALLTRQKSIKKADFLIFLELLHQKRNRLPSYCLTICLFTARRR